VTSLALEPLPRGRLGWLRTIVGLLIGELAAAMLISLPLFALARLGLRDPGAALYHSGTATGPFPVNGPWSVAADLELALVVLWVVTTCVCEALRLLGGRDVSSPIVAATIAVTGFAPFFAVHVPRVPAEVGFVVAVVVVHYVAVGRGDRRIPWRPTVIALAVGLLLPVGYALAHPFRVSAVGTWTMGVGANQKPRALVALRNGGLTSATLSTVDAPVRAGNAFRPVPLRGLEVAARHDVRLYFPGSRCAPRTIHLRYRMLGRSFAQPLHLSVCG
jgi:hypothetical protein